MINFYSKTERGFTIAAPFEAMTFPGGEAHVKMLDVPRPSTYRYQIADVRGADSHDLLTLAMWADLCMQWGQKRVVILPYLPGARADKNGQSLGALVYSRFVSELVMPDQIITLDPHSAVMPELFAAVEENSYTEYPFERIIRDRLGDNSWRSHPYVGVIAPDKGAVARAARAASVLHVPVYEAGKTRDFETGQLSGFTCPELPKEGKLLVVDDICDGGGTFIGLAQATGLDHSRLDLWVTHGIFSKGIAELSYSFGNIFTTDSWGTDIQDENLTVIPVLPYLMGEINV